MILLLYISFAASTIFRAKVDVGAKQFFQIPDGYHEASITLQAGTALMMVEWDNAIMNIIIGSQRKITITKDLGYSLFTFKDGAIVNLEFPGKCSYYGFSAPKSSSIAGAIIHASNLQKEEITVEKNNRNIYLNSVGVYKLSTDLNTECSLFQSSILSYKSNDVWLETSDYDSLNLDSVEDTATFYMGGCITQGKLNIESKEGLTPTVPTMINIEFKKTDDKTNFAENMAYGGYGNTEISEKIEDLAYYKYVFIENCISNSKDNHLYFRGYDGVEKEVKSGELFFEAAKAHFTVDVSISSKKCNKMRFGMYSSGDIKVSYDHHPIREYIYDDLLPSDCFVKPPKVGKGIITLIVVLVIVVVVVVIVVVVIVVIKKKRANRSSQENNDTNAENV